MGVVVCWRPWCEVQKLGGSRTPAANPPQMPRRQGMAVAVVQKFKVQQLGVQQLGVQGHRVQRQGSSSEFSSSEFSSSEFSSSEFRGTESRGRAAARSSGAPSPEAGQQLGVLGHRVQRQGSSSEFWGTESRGRAADQQAEKLLTSLKTEKAPVWVSVGCRKRWPRPLRSIHRGAEKAGTGIRGSPRTGRAAENSPPLRSLMIS